MKDFDNVMKAFVKYYDYEGHWFEDGEGNEACSCDFDFENNWIVLYEDYKELLEEYKKLKWRIEQLEK